ncbi:hypothetical protein GUJ93_ZPchr0007g4577 [Zizania palustris]|uniref:Exocyst component Exo84 C-terminal domain-containing protein n=1 Tax=Zizania palustris TaxID=103762 RepID=A0A8J5TFR2_ZIZPA|nr:hypothetical protein GUJ93_ZPchr0007g4577 [Zizania palustris]
MESSSEEELEEDFPGHEWITPQSSIRAAYQSQTEKGIRKICSELLELKDAIETCVGICSPNTTLSSEYLRRFQGKFSGQYRHFACGAQIDEALLALETEEKKYIAKDDSGKESDAEISAHKTAIIKRKSILEDQLVRYSEQPSLSITDLRKSLSGLIKIGKEVIDLNFRRLRRKIVDSAKNDDILLPTPQEGSRLSSAVAPNIMLTSSGKKFMSIVNDVLDQVTPMTIVHFGASDDDNLVESKEPIEFKAESDAQQIQLIGTAYTVADELLPAAVSKFFDIQTEKKGIGGSGEGLGSRSIYSIEYKEWKRNLQHSLDKLRDYFCLQYVLSFIYLEGKSRLDARMYLELKTDDLLWESDPSPSLPFQALFVKLRQLASVAGDVLLGKERIQKVLLSRLTETVVMWLSNEQEFWDVFEDESIQLRPSGLQQLILDMHFVVEIAVCGRYPHRPVQQLVSVVITRAIAAFSARHVDPQSALPEDEWFLDMAKSAINKQLGTSGSESELEEPEPDSGHIEISDSEESNISTPSTVGSEDTFASANNDDLESPIYFTDPEA